MEFNETPFYPNPQSVLMSERTRSNWWFLLPIFLGVLVEHTIGRLKRYARLADPYDGNAAGFNREFNVITGLVNLNLLWDCMEKGPPPPGQWKTSVD